MYARIIVLLHVRLRLRLKHISVSLVDHACDTMDTDFLDGIFRSRSQDQAKSRDRRIRRLCVLNDERPVCADSFAPRVWRIGIAGVFIAGPEARAEFVRVVAWPFGSIRRSSRAIVTRWHIERWNRFTKRNRSHASSRPGRDFREQATSLRPVLAIVHGPEPDCLFERAESVPLTSDDRFSIVDPDPGD